MHKLLSFWKTETKQTLSVQIDHHKKDKGKAPLEGTHDKAQQNSDIYEIHEPQRPRSKSAPPNIDLTQEAQDYDKTDIDITEIEHVIENCFN